MRIVLAGGGTTGHISPMLATAEVLRERVPGAGLVCVGTPRGLETTLVPQAGFELRLVDPVPLPRRITPQLFSLPWRLAKSVGQAKEVLRDFQAEAVVGFGGYASLPVFLAARRLGLPVVLHEANAVPGLANRIAARFAVTVCVTFANTGLPRQQVTGLPVRRAVAGLDRLEAREQARGRFGLDPGAKVLLVSGGSQGARRLNQATIAALPRLDQAGVSVLHVTGKANFDEPVDLPRLTGSSYVRVAYVDRMEEAYAAADLMLARSGAATVTETAMVGLPAIYVPLPHGNGEQAKNAAGVVAAGGGLLVADADLTGERLAREVVALFQDQDRLARMGRAAQDLMPRDAAEQVAERVVAAAGSGKDRP